MTNPPGSPAVSGDYFYTPALKGLVQQLAHLAFFGDGISVVLGPRASGKTALSVELQQEFMAAHGVARIALDSELELLECVEEVALALGLASAEAAGEASVGEILADLRHYAQALAQDKKLVVLIIDDAQHLDDQAIGALISLLQGHDQSNSGLHLVLLSEPGLERRIDSLQIVDVALYDFELPNFSPSELANFLEAYGSLGDALNSSKLQKIWAASRGYPGLALEYLGANDGESTINKEAKAGLSLLEKIQKNLPFGHMAAIAVLVIILLASFFISRDDDKDSERKRTTVALPPQEVAGAQATRAPQMEQANDEEMPPSTDNEGAAGFIERKGIDTSVGGNVSTQTANTAKSPQSDSQTRNVETPPADIPSASPIIKASPAVEEPTPNASVAAMPTSVPSAPNDEGPKPLSEDEVFLIAQNPDFFTLQVVAASKRDSLDNYMQRQPNRASLKIYRGSREGKTWFVVVQGVYSTRALALDALKSLPKEQANAGPWPRKFSSIHEEIETFRRN